MAQIKQHKIDIFMRIELQFQKCNFSPISIKSLGICGFLLVARSLCFLNVSVIVFFFVFVIVIVFLLDMSCPIIALITCFKGLSGCFFAVFSKVWMARSFLELSCEGQLKTFLHNQSNYMYTVQPLFCLFSDNCWVVSSSYINWIASGRD